MNMDIPRASGPAEEEAGTNRQVGTNKLQDGVTCDSTGMVKGKPMAFAYAKGHGELVTIGLCEPEFWFSWRGIPIAVTVGTEISTYHLESGNAPKCVPVDVWDPRYASACAAANYYVDYVFTHEVMSTQPHGSNPTSPRHEGDLSEEELRWAEETNASLQSSLNAINAAQTSGEPDEPEGPEASLRDVIEEWLSEEGLEVDSSAYALVNDCMLAHEHYMRMPVSEALRWAENWTFRWDATWLYLALPVKDGIFVIHPDNEEYRLMVECRKFSNYPIGTSTCSGDIVRRN